MRYNHKELEVDIAIEILLYLYLRLYYNAHIIGYDTL